MTFTAGGSAGFRDTMWSPVGRNRAFAGLIKMSLRPRICGFDFAKFRALFGSGDLAVVEAIQREFERNVARYPAGYPSEYRKEFSEVLHEAVHHGIPFLGLVEETRPHFAVADLMAAHNQELLVTDSDYWNISGFGAAWESGSLFTVSDEDTGFSHIIYGRPLFAEDFDTEWNFYGYLLRDELRYMQSRLRPAAPVGPDSDVGNQLLEDLKRWCDELLRADKDLWCSWG